MGELNVGGTKVSMNGPVEGMHPYEQMMRSVEAEIHAQGWDQNLRLIPIAQVPPHGIFATEMPTPEKFSEDGESEYAGVEATLTILMHVFNEVDEDATEIMNGYKEKGWLPRNMIGLLAVFEQFSLPEDACERAGHPHDDDQWIQNHPEAVEQRVMVGIFADGTYARLTRDRDGIPELEVYEDEPKNGGPNIREYRPAGFVAGLYIAMSKKSDRDEVFLG